MIRTNVNRTNALRTIAAPRKFLAWGKTNLKNINAKQISTNVQGNVNVLIFAAVLVVCSVAVGCSSDKPKPVSSNNQIPVTQAQSPVAPVPAPTVVADNKPVPKKIVHKKTATVNYTDKTYGVTFEYPRRYAIETGDAAADLLTSSPVPMNFVQPGGVALAAVELPETGFANTDFSSAFFDVSVHKGLTADQCSEFAVPEPKVMTAASTESTQAASASVQTNATQAAPTDTTSAAKNSDQAISAKPSADSAAVASSSSATSNASVPSSTSSSSALEQGSKLMIGDLELRAAEAVSGEGTRQSDAKYFHIFQNGSCYEFAVNVTTVASTDGLIKHVDRDKVFSRLEQILSTVKIDEVKPATAETTAEAPSSTSSTTAQENPAQ